MSQIKWQYFGSRIERKNFGARKLAKISLWGQHLVVNPKTKKPQINGKSLPSREL